MEQDEIKKHALERLCKIAEAMERTEPGTAFYKELQRDYKIACEQAGITKNGNLVGGPKLSSKQIKESREKALQQVIEYLDNIDHWREELPKKHTGSMEYIVVSHQAMYKGMIVEINLEMPDPLYTSISGVKAYKARKGLFLAHQIESYPNIEYGLIKYGIALIKGRNRKIEFFNKYAIPYNGRLKK